MRAPDDPYPDALARIINARIAGDEAAALAEMARHRFLPPERRTERWPATSVIARVHARDRYQCRYCGERVILPAVMRLVSRLYPELFPYHRNWKADSTHPAFVARSATLDHVRPIADGGDPLEPANLATACWGCNRRKGDLRLDELGWSLVEPSIPNWQGLTELFRPLWEAVGRPPLSEDEHGWMRAVETARLSAASVDSPGADSLRRSTERSIRMIDPTAAIRLARPSRDLAAAERFYADGLGLQVLYRASAESSDEHDLIMLGWRQASWHLELVGGPHLTVAPSPTAEDLLVLYLSAPVDEALIARLERAGGRRVAQGAYWDRWGVTVEDPDGYRLVLSSRAWSNDT
jgi:5-methylcytosine-specific restriction endonuclease McrA